MDAKTAKYAVLSLVLLGLSFSFITATIKVIQRSRRLADTKVELVALQQEKARLEDRLGYVKSPEFVEEEARNKLNMIKPGEEVYLRPKILGDDLLGVQDGQDAGRSEVDKGEGGNLGSINKVGGFFAQLFDKIKQILLP